MSKKVLVLSSTPRKGGNSDVLCDKFTQGAKEVGHSVEKINLREKHINYCTGCGACTRGMTCPQKDDATEIIQKMIDAFELMKYVHSLSDDEERTVSEGLSLFCKYFRNLWD